MSSSPSQANEPNKRQSFFSGVGLPSFYSVVGGDTRAARAGGTDEERPQLMMTGLNDDSGLQRETEALRETREADLSLDTNPMGSTSMTQLRHHERRGAGGAYSPLDAAKSPRPVASRWVMLFYLSSLAMLSDWICFSAAPISELIQRNFHTHDSNLVTCFLATNVCFCLLEPGTVRKYGLRTAVVGGAFLMSAGCTLRYLACVMADTSGDDKTTTTTEQPWLPRVLLLVGTTFVGAAQPFFQCTPSLLAANWFGESETTLAATVALNANQLGIAASYAVGATSVRTDEALSRYFLGLMIASIVLAIGTWRHFKERPTKPPSYSALAQALRRVRIKERDETFDMLRADSERMSAPAVRTAPDDDDDSPLSIAEELALSRRRDIEEEDEFFEPPKLRLRRWLVNTHMVGHGAVELTREFWEATKKLRSVHGFDTCVISFVASIVASNLFSTFLPHLVIDSEDALRNINSESKTLTYDRVAYLGAGFQLAIMAGSITIGATVDITKAYKTATLVAFGCSFATLCVIADVDTRRNLLDASILLLGFFVGPIQPLTAELAVEVTYPDGEENTIVALQQTCGNLISAGAVPIFLHVQRLGAYYELEDLYNIRVEYALIAFVMLLSALFFCTALDAPLKRNAVNTRTRDLHAAVPNGDNAPAVQATRSTMHPYPQRLKTPPHQRCSSVPSAYMTF